MNLKDKKVEISIIIPTYNRLKYLPKAVNSCRSTKHKSEIIVVDDGSTDGTWDWLKKQPDLVCVRQANSGQSWARNAGKNIAKGKYVKFLDSDDYYIEGTLDSQLEIAEAEGADVVVSGLQNVNEAGQIISTEFIDEGWDLIERLLGDINCSSLIAYLYRRELIQNIYFRPNMEGREDRMFMLEAALLNPKICYFHRPVVNVLNHGDERSMFPKGMKGVVYKYSSLQMFKYILNELDQRNELHMKYRKASCKSLWSLAHLISYTHPDEACEVADWVYKLVPDFVPPQKGLLGIFYKKIGFKKTEQLLRLRRCLVQLISRKPKLRFHKFPS